VESKKFHDLWYQSEQSYLNHPALVKIIEDVYKVKRLHNVIEHENISIGIPAFYVNSLFSGRKITSMPFNFYPPLIGSDNNDVAMESLIRQAKSMGGKCYVEFKSFSDISPEFRHLYDIQTIQPSRVSLLTLEGEYEEQRKKYQKRFSQKLSTHWKKSVEMNIKIESARTFEELKEWYMILLKLYRDKHKMIAQPFRLFEKLIMIHEEQDFSDLLIAKIQDNIIGGIVILKDKMIWEYSWGATLEKYNHLGVNKLLLDYAIQKAILARARIFGFGSSSPTDKNLRFFKSRWGSEEHTIYYHYWNYTPKEIDLNSSYLTVRNLYSKLPLFILAHLPNLIIPHLV